MLFLSVQSIVTALRFSIVYFLTLAIGTQNVWSVVSYSIDFLVIYFRWVCGGQNKNYVVIYWTWALMFSVTLCKYIIFSPSTLVLMPNVRQDFSNDTFRHFSVSHHIVMVHNLNCIKWYFTITHNFDWYDIVFCISSHSLCLVSLRTINRWTNKLLHCIFSTWASTHENVVNQSARRVSREWHAISKGRQLDCLVNRFLGTKENFKAPYCWPFSGGHLPLTEGR